MLLLLCYLKSSSPLKKIANVSHESREAKPQLTEKWHSVVSTASPGTTCFAYTHPFIAPTFKQCSWINTNLVHSRLPAISPICFNTSLQKGNAKQAAIDKNWCLLKPQAYQNQVCSLISRFINKLLMYTSCINALQNWEILLGPKELRRFLLLNSKCKEKKL